MSPVQLVVRNARTVDFVGFVRLELVSEDGRASAVPLPEEAEVYALAARSLPTRARAVQLSRAPARALASESRCPGLVRAEIWRYRLESPAAPHEIVTIVDDVERNRILW